MRRKDDVLTRIKESINKVGNNDYLLCKLLLLTIFATKPRYSRSLFLNNNNCPNVRNCPEGLGLMISFVYPHWQAYHSNARKFSYFNVRRHINTCVMHTGGFIIMPNWKIQINWINETCFLRYYLNSQIWTAEYIPQMITDKMEVYHQENNLNQDCIKKKKKKIILILTYYQELRYHISWSFHHLMTMLHQ